MITVGTQFDEAWTEAEMLANGKGYAVGNRATTRDGKVYVFVQANGAITGDGYVVSIDEDFQAIMVDTDTAATVAEGLQVGVVECAFADNDYGWAQIYGPCGIRTEASALANAKLAPTGTGGQVDDASGSAGDKYIQGLILHTATGGAAAVNTTGYLTYPVIALQGTYA